MTGDTNPAPIVPAPSTPAMDAAIAVFLKTLDFEFEVLVLLLISCSPILFIM
ncbi:hypothetical protein D3C73_1599920 [compost metagenome]